MNTPHPADLTAANYALKRSLLDAQQALLDCQLDVMALQIAQAETRLADTQCQKASLKTQFALNLLQQQAISTTSQTDLSKGIP